MRMGFASTNATSEVVHPVQEIQDNHMRTQRRTRKQMLRNIYGSHFPMQLQMEETILSQFQRAPGLQSSMLGLSTQMGLETEIEFEDYLNDPEFTEQQVDFHAAMEARLGDTPMKRFS
eukprot:CAMPEP_0175104338 /NCGR_PEP_ID=MMETSP0086_2-20121207/9668_1 /TAXON_ID=136419 /ORGANISM="Unknown Unknown, Strain D1" /LENGTH=117 /DNA_ID=CAMNT_0016379711 /DNA_START=66 /DNA_END=419 /DNA_ORIENTATION=+